MWQQVLLDKTTETQASKELRKSAQTKLALLNEKLNETASNKEKSLVFANIDLPELPKQQRTLPNKKPNKQRVKVLTKVKAEADGSTVAIYQQLVSDNSISIELAWPNESSARQGLFTFLYQCIGMKFGVLNNQSVTLAKTFYQNVNDEQQPSEWLRIVQGPLASQERLWLQQYHLLGTPVRLFPKVVDWQLAKLIKNQLKGKPLKNLRAHYQYDHQRLMLINIRLNGQWLSKSWTLIENKCAM